MHAGETISSIMITLAFFTAVVLSLYYYYRARHQQKMAMIEKGYQPPPRVKKDQTMAAMKWGVFFISLSIGLFMGYVVGRYTTIDSVISFFSMILLFGGLGLILNYYLERNKHQAAD